MKVTFHAGLIFNGVPDTSITCDVELPEDFLPSDVERELKSWTKYVTFASYTIDEADMLEPQDPSSEVHAVH